MSVLDNVQRHSAQGVDAAAAACRQLLADSTLSERDRWRLRGLSRCFRALTEALSPVDRVALLREATRLAGGYLRVNPDDNAVEGIDLPLLRQFGLTRGGEQDPPSLLLSDGIGSGSALEKRVYEALTLDAAVRQPYPTAVADGLLLKLSGFKSYRTPTQKAAVRALTTMPPGSSLLVTMPTGAGKSLLFELAPPWWQGGGDPGVHACAVVIVPTVALALAHAHALHSKPGLEGSAALVHGLSDEEVTSRLNAFRRGEVPLLFMSPEKAFSPRVRDVLREVAKAPAEKPGGLNAHLMGIFIDEVHIIESWGRTFRPDFQRLPGLVTSLKRINPQLRTVLLSATVGKMAQEEIERAYGGEGRFLAVNARVPRYEFDFVTARFTNASERDDRALELVDRLPRPALIYTTEVEHAHRFWESLLERGYERVALFTGQLSSGTERQHIIDDWLEDRLDLVVATSAFGMGIDKDSVRAVMHVCVPESPARYYQEIGRAARDGHQGLALLLRSEGSWDHDDWGLAYRQATSGWLTPELLTKRWGALLQDAHRRGRAKAAQDTGDRQIVVGLDAAHEGLDHRFTGERNRLWNMSLLNLLQRAGAVTVEVPEDQDDDDPVWSVIIRENWLLEAPPEEDPRWGRVFEKRAAEQDTARVELREFQRLLSGDEPECLLAGLFGLVESGASIVDPCGRCDFCRDAGFEPPTHVTFQGLDVAWLDVPEHGQVSFSPGANVVHPEDASFSAGLQGLIARLAALGIEQFVVPEEISESVADGLVETPARFGFVLLLEENERGTQALAGLPTAFLVPENHAAPRKLLERVDAFQKQWPQQAIVVVVSPEVRVEGRPIAQVASAAAPLREGTLAKLAQR